MSEVDALRAEVKKLSARATQLKMDLHDLSETLPEGWESLPEMAQRTHEAFRLLAEKRLALKQAEGR